MNLKNKNCVVVGLGISGISSIKLLRREGANVVATDSRSENELAPVMEELKKVNVKFELGGHNPETFKKCDLVIISPGVPYDIPVLKTARASGVQIIGEIELAFRHISVPIVAVTGTNGKSTTVSLIHEMIIKDGKNSFLGGNIGKPLTDLALSQERPDFAVVEISSFQLETVIDFRPNVAVCLNVTPDHLDRHPSFEEYINFKRVIYKKMTETDLLILNADDEIAKTFGTSKIQRYFFSRTATITDGCVIQNNKLIFHGKAGKSEFRLDKTKLLGAHNQENIAASALTAASIGISTKAIQMVIDTFPGLPHRMQFVRELNGVKYYNDSKGTNVGSTVKSMESFRERVVLIAGGKDKGTDLSPLSPLIKNTRALILFGEAKERMRKAWGNLTKTEITNELKEAVMLAQKESKSGDVVLFSPACSSFDQFKDYKDRGRAFSNLVNQLD